MYPTSRAIPIDDVSLVQIELQWRAICVVRKGTFLLYLSNVAEILQQHPLRTLLAWAINDVSLEYISLQCRALANKVLTTALGMYRLARQAQVSRQHIDCRHNTTSACWLKWLNVPTTHLIIDYTVLIPPFEQQRLSEFACPCLSKVISSLADARNWTLYCSLRASPLDCISAIVCFWCDSPPLGQAFLIHKDSRSHTMHHSW